MQVDGRVKLSATVEDGLAALAERFGLSNGQVEQLGRLLGALADDEHAPSTVTEPEQALDVHLADSLVALELDEVREARRLVDIGSGAGFPGLGLAVALPKCGVTVLDSKERKRAFSERLAAAAGIDNAVAVCARAEQWPQGIGAYDVAVARAVGRQPTVLEYAAPLLALGGTLVDWRGRRDAAEERAGEQAGEVLGMKRRAIVRVQPYEGARDHHLHVFVKAAPTPERFPRRVGIARKRPLAGPA